VPVQAPREPAVGGALGPRLDYLACGVLAARAHRRLVQRGVIAMAAAPGTLPLMPGSEYSLTAIASTDTAYSGRTEGETGAAHNRVIWARPSAHSGPH